MDKLKNEIVYLRSNGQDITDDKIYIESVRDEQTRDIIDNYRVGNYDSNGNYIIDADIVQELIKITKKLNRKDYERLIAETNGDYEFKSIADIPLFGKLEFRLIVTKTDAKLYLIENVFREGGGYLEVYGEKIAEYVSDTIEKQDLKSIFTIFNIKLVDDDDDGKKVEELEDIDKLMTRKIYLSLLAKQMVETTAGDEKEVFDSVVTILKTEGGEYGKKVLKNFVDRLERRPEVMTIKDKKGYNKALNDMLMGSLEVVTTQEDLQDANKKIVFDKINQMRNQFSQHNVEKAKQIVTAKQVKQVYDQVLDGKGKLSLQDLQENVESVKQTLQKPTLVAKPVLKQETRQAILKQGVKNAVIEEAPKQQDQAALKKEEQEPEKAQKQQDNKVDQKQQNKTPVQKPQGKTAQQDKKPDKSAGKEKPTQKSSGANEKSSTSSTDQSISPTGQKPVEPDLRREGYANNQVASLGGDKTNKEPPTKSQEYTNPTPDNGNNQAPKSPSQDAQKDETETVVEVVPPVNPKVIGNLGEGKGTTLINLDKKVEDDGYQPTGEDQDDDLTSQEPGKQDPSTTIYKKASEETPLGYTPDFSNSTTSVLRHSDPEQGQT